MAEQRPLRVGIIGAGLSGIVTAAHLIKAGIDVTLLERHPEPGGVWVFDECRPIEPHFPSTLASKGEEYPPNSCPDLEHSPPGLGQYPVQREQCSSSKQRLLPGTYEQCLHTLASNNRQCIPAWDSRFRASSCHQGVHSEHGKHDGSRRLDPVQG